MLAVVREKYRSEKSRTTLYAKNAGLKNRVQIAIKKYKLLNLIIMHWIETIREHMQISREELSFYLQLSVHTIQSVELGRRSLPPDSLVAAAALYDAVRNAQVNQVATPQTPHVPHQHIRHTKKLHHQWRRKLDRSVNKLEDMKKSHATACFSLKVYQALAQELPTPESQDEQVRLRWTQRQIKQTTQFIHDTSPTVQDLLAAEIVGLKNLVHNLDLLQMNSEHQTPLPKGQGPRQS